MEKKAFFFDIDETLLSWITHEIPASAVYALEELKKKGHLTFVNSGRMFSTVPDMVKELPVTGFICGCGTQIISCQSCQKKLPAPDSAEEYETLLLKRVPQERRIEITNLIWECDGDVIWEGEEDCFFPEKTSRFDRLEGTRQHFGEFGFGKSSYLESEDYIASKFCFYADEKTDLDKILKNLSEDMDVMDRGDFYEVSPISCSKASGIDFVLEHFNISKEQAYVFGDSSNDLSMFKTVHHAIAMEKHDPILDPYTEFITKKVEEDGILYALQHYGIL